MSDYISVYSRAMALKDGELVDVSKLAAEAGIVFPVALTRAVWVGCVEVPPEADGQDQTGRLWDLISMLSLAIFEPCRRMSIGGPRRRGFTGKSSAH